MRSYHERDERVILKVGKHVVTARPSGRSGYVDGPRRYGNGWVCYPHTNTVAYDAPEAVPTRVKTKLGAYCRRLPKGSR